MTVPEFKSPAELAHHDPANLPMFLWYAEKWHREDSASLLSTIERGFGVRPLACYRNGVFTPEPGEAIEGIQLDGDVMFLMPNKCVVEFTQHTRSYVGANIRIYPFTPAI